MSGIDPGVIEMDKKGDLLLNISCSHKTIDPITKLPQRMPDGRKINNDIKLKNKISKTHVPAFGNSHVFIPKHRLPVLDEFGIMDSTFQRGIPKQQETIPLPIEMKQVKTRMLPTQDKTNDDINQQRSHQQQSITEPVQAVNESIRPGKKRRRRKVEEEDVKIIPREVREAAGGLPPSFPQYRIKKFTEEYHKKKEENMIREQSEPETKKRRCTFKPGMNPRKKEKAPNLFTEETLESLDNLHPYLVSNLQKNFDIDRLTKIQKLTMPRLLETRLSMREKNFIINSGVGSGKIISYVTPIVNNLALMEPKIGRNDGIFALVLLPTRELAAKVNDVFVKMCRAFTRIVPGILTGGERKKSEKARLRKGLNILITTPGRLIDHIEHSMNLDFSRIKYCVLGDAHRLLDPIRADTAKKIAIVLRKKLPKTCVTCVATSTLTPKLRKLVDIFLIDPVIIDGFKEFESKGGPNEGDEEEYDDEE